MFGKLLFFFVFPKLGISYKVKKAELAVQPHFFSSHLLAGYSAFLAPTYWQGTPLFEYRYSFLLLYTMHNNMSIIRFKIPLIIVKKEVYCSNSKIDWLL